MQTIKKFYLALFAVGVLAFAALATLANAADIGRSTKDVVSHTNLADTAPEGILSGLYFGGSVGYGIGTQGVDFGISDGENSAGASLEGLSGDDFTFGLLGGYEQCFGRICAGVLGMYDFTEVDTDLSLRGFGDSAKWSLGMEDLWTVAGTAGFKLGTGELFGVLGYSGAKWTVRGPGVEPVDVDGFRFKTEEDLKGWTYGVGGKHQITDNLEAFVLYTYTDFDSFDVLTFEGGDVAGRVKVDPDLHIVRAGVVYKFGVDGIASRF